jgi:iron complex transport system ATP-binding protein
LPIGWWIPSPAVSGDESGSPCWLQESRFILLDEPLAALDVAHQVEVLTLVKQLSRQLNLIIVIHDINMASRFCDRLVALHSGRLLTHGEPEQIMTGRP